MGGAISRELLPTCAAMAALSIMWIVTTQFDRLMLSRLLPLTAFGDYTVVITAAAGVLMLLPVVNQILQPQLTAVVGAGESVASEQLYRSISQLVAAAFLSLGGALAVFSEPLLVVWTGDSALAVRASASLTWYALAFSITGVMSAPFMLQLAAGYLRLHLIASTGFAVALIPMIALAALYGGVEATGLCYLLMNLLYLLAWVPVIHRRLAPGCGVNWFVRDLLPAAAAAFGTLLIARQFVPEEASRLLIGCLLVLSTGLAFVAALGMSPLARKLLYARAGT